MSDWLITAARGKPKPTDEYAGMSNAQLAEKLREHAAVSPCWPYVMQAPAPRALLEEVARRLETK